MLQQFKTVGPFLVWLLFSAAERSTAFLYNDIMLTSKAGPNALVSH